MTLEELAGTLPSGFHDSALKNLSIDYENRTLRLEMALKVGDPDGPREQRDDVRNAQIDISGVVFFAIEPPSSAKHYDFKSPGEVSLGDSYETRSIPQFAGTIEKELLNAVSEDAFVQSFFVKDWNSYFHVAAKDCTMKWLGDAQHYKGPRRVYFPGETIEPE